MYIQITNRCNMTCEHCCYSCTAQGDDMSLETFRAALELCRDHGCPPFLGGGEPTVHPEFETILLESITAAAEIGEGVCGIITNGKIKRRAMMLVALTRGSVISAELSRDIYHDPIDMETVYAFESLGEAYGWKHGVRDTSNGGQRDPLPHGRAKSLLDWDDDEYAEDTRDSRDCPCEQWVIKPNGDIHQCGCEDSPKVGHVNEGVESPLNHTCYRDSEWVTECCDNDVEHLLYA